MSTSIREATKPSEQPFNLEEAERELRQLRRRMRVLEQSTLAHLRTQMTALMVDAGKIRTTEGLVSRIRRVLDETEGE